MQCIDWLVYPLGWQLFVENYLEQNLLVVKRNNSSYYDKLLSVENVDEVIKGLVNVANFSVSISPTREGVNCDAVYRTVKKDNIEIRSGINVARLKEMFNKGDCSVVVNNMANCSLPVSRLLQNIGIEISGNCYADLFLTPPEVKNGFGIHYDLHDVYVLQIFGSKRWQVYESPVHLPDSPEHYRGFVRDETKYRSLADVELLAGDLLYLPRGFVHNVTTNGSPSIHLTVGCNSKPWSEVMSDFLIDLSNEVEVLKESLPASIRIRRKKINQIKKQLRSTYSFEAFQKFVAKQQKVVGSVK